MQSPIDRTASIEPLMIVDCAEIENSGTGMQRNEQLNLEHVKERKKKRPYGSTFGSAGSPNRLRGEGPFRGFGFEA